MKRRITLSIALVLSIVFVSLMISDTRIVTSGAAIAELPVTPTPAPPTACDMLKGKTYIAFNIGKFEGYLNAASSAKFTFDDQGNGTGRGLFVNDATTNTVEQRAFTVKCDMFQEKNGVRIGMLTFKNAPSGIDAGSSRIWVYDDGAKFWGEPTIRTRPMDGWNLQVPAPPSTIR